MEEVELKMSLGAAFSLPHRFSSLWLRLSGYLDVGEANKSIDELFFSGDVSAGSSSGFSVVFGEALVAVAGGVDCGVAAMDF